MKTKQITTKDFDAVKFMRDTRDKIDAEIQHMDFQELKKYFEKKQPKLSK
ncbi:MULTISPECIES: hypothetical protein [Mucilaginibacter]|nr:MULTISPECIES: hypothetical protein [Mucilaginibacter]NVM62873.1 hypothetical protein [Mucilaginibacter sp. SG538B]GGA88947.1 hypothetical protein GCM10011500_00730 [Mucilaginibacter rubeus]